MVGAAFAIAAWREFERERERRFTFEFQEGDVALLADDGNDVITLGPGQDTVYAEAGDNHITATSDGSVDIIYCGPGPADTLTYLGPVDPLDVRDGCETVTII